MLFAPGNHLRRSEKVFQVGADIAVLDLEDSVALTEKVQTRDAVRGRIERHPNSGALVFVRINAISTQFAMGDLEAVVVSGTNGIVVPKVESARDVQIV